MEIRLHSSKKHRAIGYYLFLIRSLIKSKFKKLYYVDLYCGDGNCFIDVTQKQYSPPIIASILKHANEPEFEVHCFLNDLDTEKINTMKVNTITYSQFIENYSSEDANKCYKNILEKIPANQFSIFMLDPTNHNDLKWKTIEDISKHTAKYYGNKIRRPELLINCMTFSMIQAYRAKSYKSINEALGTDKWFEEINKNKEEHSTDTPVIKAFLDTFVNQLKSLGYKVPTPIEITGTGNNNPIFYLIWATNEEGCEIIDDRLIPWINRVLLKAEKENEIELKRAKAKKQGQCFLDKFIST